MKAKEKEAAELVKRLHGWRERNGYSQRVAAEVLGAHGVGIDITTLHQWESGRRRPGKLAGGLVEKFLERYEGKTIKGVRTYQKKSRLTAKDLAEIRRLLDQGETMKAIGKRFGVSELYISKIVSGERLPKVFFDGTNLRSRAHAL